MDSKLLKRGDQLTVAVVVATVLAALAARWGASGPRVNIERAAPLGYAYLVDINEAGWPELAQLPDVGEVLARRIVMSRGELGPFSKPEDLLRVNGIGPRRLERIRGYLEPLPGESVLVFDN